MLKVSSCPDPTDVAAERAIIEDGNEGLVRLYENVFDQTGNSVLERATKDLLWFQGAAFVMVALLCVAFFFEASWWTRGIMVLMTAAVCVSGTLGGITARKLKRQLTKSRSGWHKVTQHPVVFEELDDKAFDKMIKAASAFARDEDTIVYYHVSENQNWCSVRVTFGFLNDEARIMFRLKFK